MFWVLMNSGIFPDNLLFLRSSIETFSRSVSGIAPDKRLSCRSNTTCLVEFTCGGMSPYKVFAERFTIYRVDMLNKETCISPSRKLFEINSSFSK